MKKLTPVYVVEHVEPSIQFWVDRLGFEKTVEVPDGDSIGFVILVKGPVEIMYQSFASVQNDIPELAASTTGMQSPNLTYIEVPDIDEIFAKFTDWPLAVPKRTTFYGATEFGVREPGGNLIVFAQQPAPQDSPGNE